MKIEKQILAHLEKCYSVTIFKSEDGPHLFVASEAQSHCFSFTMDGVLEDVLWTGPGGVMTMEQAPGHPTFFAVQKFYGPNNAKEARLAYFEHDGHCWAETILCHLPFLHRIGIVQRDGKYYLLACTIKSGHKHLDDWSTPGTVYVAEISKETPRDIFLSPLVTGLYHNHGLCIRKVGDHSRAYIGSDEGVLELTPPGEGETEWTQRRVLDRATSDVCFADLDEDGEEEMIAIHAFHGDTLVIYKNEGGSYVPVYEPDKKLPFLHSMSVGRVDGRNYAFLGYRGDDAALLAFSFSPDAASYQYSVIDQGGGPANSLFYEREGEGRLLVTNRESHTVILYHLS